MTNKPFSGPLRKLVLAFDVGTTFSGIAYAILDPGQVPKILNVTRFPEQGTGDFKIPSALWYTQDGKVRAAGAEATADAMRLAAEDEDLIYVEWFKLHLRPRTADDEIRDGDVPALPSGKSAIDVLADFLAYLFKCAQTFIKESHPSGESLWTSFHDRIDFVLSHPNGWEGVQQARMRQAAIAAGLVPNNLTGHARVHFVTEGEASLHYCIDSGLASGFIKDDATVMIIDAGGGTVDLSSYVFNKVVPMTVEEIAPVECILQGSTRVNMRAAAFLRERLGNSRFSHDEDFTTMLSAFEKSTKATFKDAKSTSFIKFGRTKDNDPKAGIRGGQVIISGNEMAQLFEPSIDGILRAILRQQRSSGRQIKNAFLVGGFAASPWLFTCLKATATLLGIDLARPDNHTNKAVAEGAVSFFLDNVVSTRVARVTYGSSCVLEYDPDDPEHFKRSEHVFKRASGQDVVPGAFSIILAKGTRLRVAEEVESSFDIEVKEQESLNHIVCEIMRYKGPSAYPQWMDVEPALFSTLCTVIGDTSKVARRGIVGSNGLYYEQKFKVVLSCGLTEMKAQLSWMENGVEKRSPAKIVYDDDISPC